MLSSTIASVTYFQLKMHLEISKTIKFHEKRTLSLYQHVFKSETFLPTIIVIPLRLDTFQLRIINAKRKQYTPSRRKTKRKSRF